MTAMQIAAVQALPADTIFLKVLDEATPGLAWSWQLQSSAVEQWRTSGKRIVGWGFHTGAVRPDAVASAIAAMLSQDIEAYVFDIEQRDAGIDFQTILDQVRQTVETTGRDRLAITSHAFPAEFDNVPYAQLAALIPTAFPQAYFMTIDACEAAAMTAKSVRQYEALFETVSPIFNALTDDGEPVRQETLSDAMRGWPGASLFRAPHEGDNEVGLSDAVWREP